MKYKIVVKGIPFEFVPSTMVKVDYMLNKEDVENLVQKAETLGAPEAIGSEIETLTDESKAFLLDEVLAITRDFIPILEVRDENGNVVNKKLVTQGMVLFENIVTDKELASQKELEDFYEQHYLALSLSPNKARKIGESGEIVIAEIEEETPPNVEPVVFMLTENTGFFSIPATRINGKMLSDVAEIPPFSADVITGYEIFKTGQYGPMANVCSLIAEKCNKKMIYCDTDAFHVKKDHIVVEMFLNIEQSVFATSGSRPIIEVTYQNFLLWLLEDMQFFGKMEEALKRLENAKKVEFGVVDIFGSNDILSIPQFMEKYGSEKVPASRFKIVLVFASDGTAEKINGCEFVKEISYALPEGTNSIVIAGNKKFSFVGKFMAAEEDITLQNI